MPADPIHLLTPIAPCPDSFALADEDPIDAGFQRHAAFPKTDRPVSDLARALPDQLHQHHGCCQACHEQKRAEHETQHTEHTILSASGRSTAGSIRQ